LSTCIPLRPLETAVLDHGIRLLKEYGKTFGLRTLDALQLGAYSLLHESNWAFVCADRNLVYTAEKIGFHVINPTV
jgi:hypothetical protein